MEFLREVERKEWNDRVDDISLTKEFAEANKSEGEVYYFQKEKNKAVIVIKKKFHKVFSRAQVFTNSLDKEFLETILSVLKEMGIPYARIGNNMFGLDKKVVLDFGKTIERHTFVLDLERSEEDLWKNFDKKLRNVIRKSEKEGVKILEIKDERNLKEYYKISLETEKYIKKIKGRKTFQLQKYDFFKKILEEGIGRFFIAKFEEKIIAGALFLIWKEKAVYFHSGILREHSQKQAQSLIHWHSIKKLKKEGIKEYDLGGVTLNLKKDDSRNLIYEFKRKFNGEIKEFYNVEIFLSSLVKKIQNSLIKVFYGSN